MHYNEEGLGDQGGMLLSAVFKCGCHVVSQCQFMYAAKVKIQTERFMPGTHIHVLNAPRLMPQTPYPIHFNMLAIHTYIIYIFSPAKCDLYEKSQQQAFSAFGSMCVWNISQRLSFLNSISRRSKPEPRLSQKQIQSQSHMRIQFQMHSEVQMPMAMSLSMRWRWRWRSDVEASRCINKRFRPLCIQRWLRGGPGVRIWGDDCHGARRPHRRCVFY